MKRSIYITIRLAPWLIVAAVALGGRRPKPVSNGPQT